MESGNTKIYVGDHVSISDIGSWQFGRETDIVVGMDVDFEPGAEGIALSVLRTAMEEKTYLVLLCEFEEPTSGNLLETGFFGTVFGVSLARVAREIRFGKIARSASAKLRPLIAEVYQTKNGVLGVGKKKTIICIDPKYTVPPVLESMTGHEAEFPLPSIFERVLRAQVSDMGLTRLLNSSVEASIINLAHREIEWVILEHFRVRGACT